MPEERSLYKVGKPPTIEEIASRPCGRLFTDPGYEPPTWKDLRDLMAATGWKGAEVAAIVGAAETPQKGSRTVRKWTADPATTNESRQISYAVWRLLLINTGVVDK